MIKKRLIKQRIRLQGFLIFSGVIALLFLQRIIFQRWKGEFWDEILEALGILIVLFGYLLRVAARGHKKERSKEGNVLVDDGPYGMIRHPMYTGSFLIGFGIICILFNVWPFIVLIAVFVSIYIPHVKKEERELQVRFNETYSVYAQHTARFFPKVQEILRLQDYVSIKWEWLKDEWLSFAFVFLLIVVVEVWQDYQSFGLEELIEKPLELLSMFMAIFLALCFCFKRRK